MTKPEHCPHCGVSLLGEPIPADRRVTPEQWASPDPAVRFSRPYAPDQTHFRREIGYEDRDVYDGVLFWFCPDCGHAWHFWTNAHGSRYQAAETAVALRNQHRKTAQ